MTAGQLVAGVPAAARAVREAVLAGLRRIHLAAPGGFAPDALTVAEVNRLAGSAQVAFSAEREALAGAAPSDMIISGERLVPAAAIRAALDGHSNHPGVMPFGNADGAALAQIREGGGARALAEAGRLIVAATAKPGDGIVSRYINRPLSQAISRLWLRWPGLRPIHGTAGTALLGAAMLICLLQATPGGLIAGAVLFQAASMFDGVDGEVARATFRTSARGAALDSLIDAATNLGFFAGVAYSIYRQGHEAAALTGVLGLALFAFGLAIIGRRARRDESGMTFNAVKEHFTPQRSKLMTALTWLTMRDFFALVAALFIIAGLAPLMMIAFAIIAGGWLVVVLTVMRGHAA